MGYNFTKKVHTGAIQLILTMLRNGNQISQVESRKILHPDGLYKLINTGVIVQEQYNRSIILKLDIPRLREISYVVDEKTWEQLTARQSKVSKENCQRKNKKKVLRRQAHRTPVVVEDSEIRLADILIPELERRKKDEM